MTFCMAVERVVNTVRGCPNKFLKMLGTWRAYNGPDWESDGQ